MTTMRSALSTVARRCAMTSVVRPRRRRSSASCTSRSLSASSELVASSSSSTRGIAQDRAGDRDPLPLAAGQAHALLAEEGVEALGQAVEELARRGRVGCRAHLLVGGLRPAVAQVRPGIGREDHRLLRHEADPGAKRHRVEIAQIGAVQQDRAGARVVEAHQQLEHAGLAGAGRTDQGDRLARRDRDVEPMQGREVGPRRIGEVDRGEAHSAARRLRQGRRLRRGRDRGPRVEQLEHPLGRPRGALQIAHDLAERPGRGRDHRGVEHERRQLAAVMRAGQHVAAADPEHHDDRAEHQRDHGAREQAARPGPLGRRAERLLAEAGEAAALAALLGEGLHRADRVQGLLGLRAELADAVLGRGARAAAPCARSPRSAPPPAARPPAPAR